VARGKKSERERKYRVVEPRFNNNNRPTSTRNPMAHVVLGGRPSTIKNRTGIESDPKSI